MNELNVTQNIVQCCKFYQNIGKKKKGLIEAGVKLISDNNENHWLSESLIFLRRVVEL